MSPAEQEDLTQNDEHDLLDISCAQAEDALELQQDNIRNSSF